mmetsp:Transcript_14491/g.40196  ORF Transcript_14491/g.40196 Transcript_14491/m.40196 type:complete len:201 (+) Transcript_14491:1738-2340(+)
MRACSPDVMLAASSLSSFLGDGFGGGIMRFERFSSTPRLESTEISDGPSAVTTVLGALTMVADVAGWSRASLGLFILLLSSLWGVDMTQTKVTEILWPFVDFMILLRRELLFGRKSSFLHLLASSTKQPCENETAPIGTNVGQFSLPPTTNVIFTSMVVGRFDQTSYPPPWWSDLDQETALKYHNDDGAYRCVAGSLRRI